MNNGIVLVGVLKNKRDLELLFKKRWYRIPLEHAPERKFQYLAFYQPAIFGRAGKSIRYYGKVLECRIMKRRKILPDELKHPRTDKEYIRLRIGKIKTLARPIKNTAPRRISFGFTNLDLLLAAKNILQLYEVAPTEEIMASALKQAGISASAQYRVSGKGRRYRLDFAIFCRNGKIAIECDNRKAHSGKNRRKKDRDKDNFLRRRGWKVLRLAEKDIVSDAGDCISRIQKAIRARGGLLSAGK